jgi:hypothetical protein
MRCIYRAPINFTVVPAKTVRVPAPSPVTGGINAQAPPPLQLTHHVPLPKSSEESYGDEEEEEAEADVVEPLQATEQFDEE